MLRWLRLTICQALYHVLEEGNGTHSSTLAWRIPWMEEPGRLQSMGSPRVRHDWATSLSLFTFMHWRRKWSTHSSALAWRIPGTGEPGGLPSMGSHRVGHDWSDLAAAAVPRPSQGGETAVPTGRAMLIVYSCCLFWLVSHCGIQSVTHNEYYPWY